MNHIPGSPPPVRKSITRPAWLLLGWISLVLAAIGVALPVLPTTPLVILAAFAFGKGSPRLHAMLENHPRFGPIIREWREKGVIAPRYKAMAVGMMVLTLVASIAFGLAWQVILVQGVSMAAAAGFVLTRPDGDG
ncbi:MAG: YbaN family protein [Pseudorhodobacter sp.]